MNLLGHQNVQGEEFVDTLLRAHPGSDKTPELEKVDIARASVLPTQIYFLLSAI